MLDRINSSHPPIEGTRGCVPKLTIKKLGIVSRNYNDMFGEHYDFSHVLPDVLKMLDENECDAALFSLYSIIPRRNFNVHAELSKLQLEHLKAVFLEEFHAESNGASDSWPTGDQVVYHRSNGKWQEYRFRQAFGSLKEFKGRSDRCMKAFIADELPKRLLGNCCVLVCGESNGVRWSRYRQIVEDTYGLRAAIPPTVKVILNPVHDYMVRPEMNKKRKFLSGGGSGRWVVSVWNKGKKDKNDKPLDARGSAWKVLRNGEENIEENIIDLIQNNLGVEIGILNIEFNV